MLGLHEAGSGRGLLREVPRAGTQEEGRVSEPTPGEGVATHYVEAIPLIRARLAHLAIRYEDFDTHCSFPDGLTGKCLGPSMVKRFGVDKFFDALAGAGLRIRLEEDPEQTAKMRQRITENYVPRQANQSRPNNHASAISSHVLSRAFGHILRKARKNRWANTTKAERSAHARMMAMTRHRKERKKRKAAKIRRDRLRASDTMSAG